MADLFTVLKLGYAEPQASLFLKNSKVSASNNQK